MLDAPRIGEYRAKVRSSVRMGGSSGPDTGELGNGYKGIRLGYRYAPGCLTKQPVRKVGWAIFCQIHLHASGGSFPG